MTNHVARLYAALVGVLVLFLSWAVIAAHPWVAKSATADPRLAALVVRQAQLKQEAALVQKLLAARGQGSGALASAPAPAVSLTNLPPLTSTRTS